VNNFNISRINTPLGIFRVSGLWSYENIPALHINIDSIEVMGTDGWVLLNQSSDHVIELVKELTPILIIHLQKKR
jgi:hypothetical protein